MSPRRARILLILGTIVVAITLILAATWLTKSMNVSRGAPIDAEGSITVVMCPACETVFNRLLLEGNAVHCALYDVGETTGTVLAAVDAAVITDDETDAAYGNPVERSGLMHNKFCIIDGLLVTSGSYNPTDGGVANHNNLVLIESPTLARNYREAFDAIADGGRASAREPIVYLGKNEEGSGAIRVVNAFCPLDGCEDQVVAVLDDAKESIQFMTFSFTSDAIGDALLRAQKRGVLVEGICDGGQSRSEREYNECARVGAAMWEGAGLLHHKVFIVDETTVVTGSYNPTAAGTARNDENVLIVSDTTFAAAFIEEYDTITAATK